MKNARCTDKKAIHPSKFKKMAGPVRIASKAVYIAWAAAVRHPHSGEEYFLMAPDHGTLIEVTRLTGLECDLSKCIEVVIGPLSKTIKAVK